MGSVPFANNWAYLDTELSWLERLLLVAVSQQRQNLKSVNRVAKTSSDKATSDWWQGLIAVKNRAYDDAVAPKSGDQPSLGYQKTLEKRIMLSRAHKIALGLPTMQMALDLSLFEKKLVLMVLAPEVQIRYGKLYHYLQTGAHCATGSLPTVELALRILCRNETERRRARMGLSGPNSLVHRRILRRVEGAPTFLGSQLQLAPEWVEYLLSENPDPSWPMRCVAAARFGHRCRERVLWPAVGVADGVKQQLQALVDQPDQPPLRLLLVGPQGVGKGQVAIALATHLKHPLHSLNLTQISPQDWPACLTELNQAQHPVVLINAAHHWLGHGSTLDRATLQHWYSNTPTHIIFTVHHRHLVSSYWRRQLTMLHIPMPDADVRLQLWQQALPHGIKGMGNVRWSSLAAGLVISGQQIIAIGQITQGLAGDEPPTLDHLQEALVQQGQTWKLR